jgi:pimeloyl-ACP methyl ester carboxylesterase
MPIVLVHGAWSGSWSWRACADILRTRGFDVYAPTLTGLAERAHVAPEHVDLSSHVADIAGLMRFENLENVLIVGHSYGGMVITGAADREISRVKAMIYLDAFVPENGQCLWDLSGEKGRQAQIAAAMAHDGGKSVPRPTTPGNTAPGAAQKFGALFTPQPIRTSSEPFISVREKQDWPPRHYVLCKAYDPSPFHAIAARVKNAPGWSYGEFDALHDVVRTHPTMVADMISERAHAWGLKPERG